MTKLTETFLKQLVLLIDALVLVAAFLGTYAVRQSVRLGALKSLESYLWLLLAVLPLWIGMLHLMGAYRELRTKAYRRIVWTILKASALGLLFFGSIVFLLKLQYVSRSFMALFFLLSVGLLAAERGLVITCYRLMLRRGYFHRNLFIVGTGPRTAELIRTIRSHVRWGIRIIGLLDEDLQRAVRFVSRHKLAGVATVGTLAQLPDLLRQYAVDEVVFVVPRSWMSRIEQAVRACELAGVRATVAVDLFNLRVARSLSSDLNGIPLISFDTAPTDQWQLAVKRVVDVSVSSLALLILLPLLPLVALVVKATSPGPILFRQIRCGLNGRRFTLYKLRSMAADAEAKQAELAHLNELNGPVFKATNDPRLTPIGKWLRKTSIDELPQLVNVLKGEMSLVGPRPPLPSEVEQYEPWQRRRLSMRPGITGYWQVNGRNHIRDFDKWMALDLEYIDRWSLGLDLKILLKTVPAVLVGKGAK